MRTVLWWLVFTGMAVNYIVRINLNIAIVSMVIPKSKGPKVLGACTTDQLIERISQDFTNYTVSFR